MDPIKIPTEKVYHNSLILDFPEKLMRHTEKIATENFNMCDVEDPEFFKEALSSRTFQVRKDALLSFLKRKGFQWQQKSSCLLQGLLKKDDVTKIVDKTSMVVKNVGKLNFGYIGDDIALVFKTATDTEDLNHEAFIGFYVTNELRKKCPAFIYSYGLMGCQMIPSTTPSIINCLKNGNKTLLLEAVAGKTLKVSIERMSNVEFLEVILQIESALNLAYQSFEFTHYDLHAMNVMIEKQETAIQVPLFLDGYSYLETKNLVRLIDYGMSFARVQDKPFGQPLALDPGLYIYSDRPYPMYDTYKILCASSIAAGNYNPRLKEEVISPLFEFFGNLDERVTLYTKNIESRVKDYCQCGKQFLSRTHEDFLNFFFETEIVKDAIANGDLLVTQDDIGDEEENVSWSQILTELFDYGRTLNSSTKYFAAIENTDDPAVKEWLDQNTDFNAIIDAEGPPLHLEASRTIQRIKERPKEMVYRKIGADYLAKMGKLMKIAPFDNDNTIKLEDVYNQLTNLLQ